jgi:hypothetical protein
MAGDHSGDLNIDGRIIIKWALEEQEVYRIKLAEDESHGRIL